MTTQPAAGDTVAPGGFRMLEGTRTVTTLGDHGRQTLIGRMKGDYRFQPLDLPYRAMIGREVDNQLSLRNRLGERVVRTMSLALSRFGGDEDWERKSAATKLAAVETLFMPDLQYMACVRMAEEYRDGWERDRPFEQCPHCSETLPVHVNVDITTLHCESWDKEPKAEYRFKHPWWLGGVLVETLTVGVARLNRSMMQLTDQDFNDMLTFNMVLLAAAVHCVNGKPRTVEWKDFQARDPKSGRGMHEADFDNLVDLHDHLMGGIASAVVWKHDTPKCGGEMPVSINWADAFFARSGA